jgi:manganese efflux pump family protein
MMDLASLLLIAVGLSMDALAVSLTIGLTLSCFQIRPALRTALFFGGFQALMPLIGWASGMTFSGWIKPFDHWVAFGLLVFIGGKMIRESRKPEGDKIVCNPNNYATLLTLAVATSIDALAVGLSLSFLEVRILTPVLVIGAVTFGLSFLGVWVGNRLRLGKSIEVLGGLVLIGVGLKILLQHLLG